MRKFIILTDSCSDLNAELRKQYNVEYVPMRYLYTENGEDKDYPASLDWEYLTVKEFYNKMRDGIRIMTSQVNEEEYTKAFDKYLSEGYDILSISCSSALSSSYKGSLSVRDVMLKKYPEGKIICIDSRNSCMGLGTICITASILREEGKTIEEVAEYVEKHKQEANQLAVVDDLVYLKRAGRVSATAAVFGGLLKIKPIIISDVMGRNVSVEKAKGRNGSIHRMAEMFKERFIKDHEYQKVSVLHADDLEGAELLKKLLLEIDPELDISIDYIGPIIGASVGPGTLAVYFYGQEVTFDAEPA